MKTRKYVFYVYIKEDKVNICILVGKIVSEIEFEFIIKSKHKSITYFNVELVNKSIVKIKAYNSKADYAYRNYKKNQIVVIKGKIRSDGAIEMC